MMNPEKYGSIKGIKVKITNMEGNKERKKLNAIELARMVRLNCLISTRIKLITSKSGT